MSSFQQDIGGMGGGNMGMGGGSVTQIDQGNQTTSDGNKQAGRFGPSLAAEKQWHNLRIGTVVKNGSMNTSHKQAIGGHEPHRIVICAQVMESLSDNDREFRFIANDGSGSLMCLWHKKPGDNNILADAYKNRVNGAFVEAGTWAYIKGSVQQENSDTHNGMTMTVYEASLVHSMKELMGWKALAATELLKMKFPQAAYGKTTKKDDQMTAPVLSSSTPNTFNSNLAPTILPQNQQFGGPGDIVPCIKDFMKQQTNGYKKDGLIAQCRDKGFNTEQAQQTMQLLVDQGDLYYNYDLVYYSGQY